MVHLQPGNKFHSLSLLSHENKPDCRIEENMAILIAINHRMEYRYDQLVKPASHVVRLCHRSTPPHADPQLFSNILPGKHFLNWQQVPFGKPQLWLVFPEKN